MTPFPVGEMIHPDCDRHKGAIEGDHPTDEQHSNRHGTCLDEDGWPDDDVAIFEDAEGANVDRTQG